MKSLFSIILIFVSITIFVFFVIPKYESIQTLSAESETYSQALDNARELEILRDSLLSKFNALSPRDLGRLSMMIPDSANNVKLILDLQQLAQQHSLSLQTASAEQDGDDQDVASGRIDVESKAYGIVRVSFVIEGTYQDFIAFMKKVEKNLRIVDVEELHFQRVSNNSGNKLQFSLQLRSYWLKDK